MNPFDEDVLFEESALPALPMQPAELPQAQAPFPMQAAPVPPPMQGLAMAPPFSMGEDAPVRVLPPPPPPPIPVPPGVLENGHTLGLTVLLAGIGSAAGVAYGGLFGGVAGGLAGGSVVNLLRAYKHIVKGTPEDDREATISATYGVLGGAASIYLFYRSQSKPRKNESKNPEESNEPNLRGLR